MWQKNDKKKLFQHIAEEHSIEAETNVNNIEDNVEIKFIDLNKEKETVNDKERDTDKNVVFSDSKLALFVTFPALFFREKKLCFTCHK